MPENYKYVSVARVIENVLRDADYQDDISMYDVVEWISRAMSLIGVQAGYEEKIETIDIENYRAVLPDDVIKLIAVRDAKTGVGCYKSTDEFILSYPEEEQASATNDPPPPQEVDYTDWPAYVPLVEGEVTICQYRLVDGYLFTNKETGTIEIKYLTYKTCEDGYPMVPDVERYLLALESYVTFKIDHRLWRRGKLSKMVRDISEQDWLWYVNSAQTKMVTPDYDTAEAMKNQLLKIVPDITAHQYSFRYLNTPTVKRY